MIGRDDPGTALPEGLIALLGVGSNMGDARQHVLRAIEELDTIEDVRVMRASPLYGSGAWGRTDQPDFVNAVAQIRTTLPPHRLLSAVKALERTHGRVPAERWGPRPLDIDILLYGDYAVAEPYLQVPHPRMWDRAFVLRPLADLRPDQVGPGGRTVRERLTDPEVAGQKVWPLN